MPLTAGERSDEVVRELVVLRQERDRLLAENARLSRLLQLRLGQTEPAPEQSALPAGASGLVTMASPTQAKVAFFAELFRSRRDVHARFWENRWKGEKGWSPVYADRWYPGIDKSRRRWAPLTASVIERHLGRDDPLHLGLYPLLPDGSCHWLATDFDGDAAMLDALAYVKAARAVGVPAALEVSRSGRGAHVWVFFAGAVRAERARAMGTVILHEAMTLRGTMRLASYDRFFPSQDVPQANGPGNLIAAPLTGRLRVDGLTCFLDTATLEPYEDQWAFLSTLDRMSVGAVERIARRAARTAVVGHDVKGLHKARATKVHPPMPPLVHAELAAGLAIPASDLTPAALAMLKHAASMANPAFYEAQRQRRSTWGIPRFIEGYDLTLDGRIIVPRGLRHEITRAVQGAGSRLVVDDARTAGTPIDVDLHAELRDVQGAAVDVLLTHEDGVLVAAPGSGKTVMACAVIAERGVSTAVLVGTKALAEQWRARIERFLRIKPGQLGAGRSKLTGVIDVVMLPSLARRKDDVADLLAGYGHVVVDECHHIAAAAYDYAVGKVAAQYWLGLTATPQRRDGLSELITWQLGPIRHTMTDSEHGTLEAASSPVGVTQRMLHLHETAYTDPGLDLDRPGALAVAGNALAADPARNAQIVDDVVAAVTAGRNCVILTRRRVQIDLLEELLTERGHTPLVLRSEMKIADRRAVVARLAEAKAGDGVLLISTANLIGEGFDAPALDTLFVAGPISWRGTLVQAAGRITRLAEGKTTAEVHDYIDVHVPVFAASLTKRMPGYRTLGFVER